MTDFKLEPLLQFLYEEGLFPDVEQWINPSVAYYVAWELRVDTVVLLSASGHEEEIDLTSVQILAIKEITNG